MTILKKTLYALYILLIVCMGLATIIEKDHGTKYVSEHIYGTWWFSALWAMLAAAGAVYFVKRRIRRTGTVLLHSSFLFILAGALLTHVTSRQGMIHLRYGETTDKYLVMEGDDVKEHKLPFTIRLDKFNIRYHDGTTAAADYETTFTIEDNGERSNGAVSMNNIYSHGSYRLYQSSYDGDMRGSILSMNSDPYGIPVTYLGYALLFFSLIYMLFEPKGTYRRLLRSVSGNKALKATMLLATVLCMHGQASAQTTVPRETAERFGKLYIMYNDRICPVQTLAMDFTKKIYGKSRYKDFTAEQVLLGFVFWNSEWSKEPMIKVKNGDLKSQLDYEDYCSMNFFFNDDMGGYVLGPYVREFYDGNNDGFHKQAIDIDGKLQLMMDVRRGTMLNMFPCFSDGRTAWYAPAEKLPEDARGDDKAFVSNVMDRLKQSAQSSDYDRFNGIINEIAAYQHKNAGTSLPGETVTKAELLYNKVPFATILFMFNLTMGFLAIAAGIFRIWKRDDAGKDKGVARTGLAGIAGLAAMVISFLALTLCLLLRWIVSGNIPMSNGYETMLLTAWLIMLLTIVACRHFRIMLAFGFLLSGFFLLVSHISYMDPQIGRMMPVLNSPLLSIHVSIIMMAYAMLSVTFICGVAAIILRIATRKQGRKRDMGLAEGRLDEIYGQTESLELLSKLFLYPALTCLGLGIFIGAIWANVSWGQYWSWDPKETWALITFMVYGVAVHGSSLPFLRKPMAYHVYMTLAFLTLLMTYFGVNYILGGMHSYA